MLIVMAVLVPFMIFAFNTLPLDNWIIDDAGISFAYARNLASGHGLVSQPGMQPVEGYSNPLWVFLLVPFFWFKLFDPVITPKLLGLALVLTGFFGIASVFRKLVRNPAFPTAMVLILLAFNAPMLIWTSSGLENALTFALGMWLLACCMNISRGHVSTLVHVWTGLIVAGVALTRPEGIVYLLLYIAATLLGKQQEDRWSSTIRQLSVGLGVILLLAGGHQIFRMLYYGDILPNPAYVKGTPGFSELLALLSFHESYLLKYRDLCASVFGIRWWLVPDIILLGSGIVLTLLVIQKRLAVDRLIPLLMTVLAAGLYLILTPDWMREFRFATLYYPTAIISLVIVSDLIIANIRWQSVRTVAAVLLTVAALATTRLEHLPRMEAFSAAPTISMAQVKSRYVDRFNQYAAYLRLDSVSQLLPDLGGTLYYSDFKTYDLAGLCDRSIALHRRVDQLQFYNYIFDTIKPTIIHSFAFFSAESRFDQDPRFLRDYVPIRDSLEAYYRDSVRAGTYLRRDAIVGMDSLLAILQRGEQPWTQPSPLESSPSVK